MKLRVNERRAAQVRKANDYRLHGMVAGYGLFWLVMAMEPYNRFDWLLENLLIFAAVVVLVVTNRWFSFGRVSYGLLLLFMALHTWGAHYSYHSTPLDDWLRGILHTERDAYDRLVHFSYGCLLAYPIKEVLGYVLKRRDVLVDVLSVMLVLASGALYELIEMWVAFLVAPEIGTMFLGMQGDPWDTQHDMELELYGALLASAIAAAVAKLRKGQNG